MKVDNIYALLAVLIVTIIPTVPAILAYLEARRTHLGVREVKNAVIEVHSIINSGAELAQARAHEEGRSEAQAENATNVAALAHNAERKGPKP